MTVSPLVWPRPNQNSFTSTPPRYTAPSFGERDVRLARLLDAQEVLADVLVCDDVDAERVAYVRVAARVVAVVVRVEHVLHRQRR